MTTPTLPPRTDERPGDGRPRRVDLALARAHLRLGSLALARTELETLAGLGALDAPGLVDLAEVRWRTGDLPGAGEAAAAALDSGAEDPVALVIAAEAASADGRPSEARRLANLAMSGVDGSIDRVFAGMPRSAVWVPDAAEPPPTAATLFSREADEDAGLAAARQAVADGPAPDAAIAHGQTSDGTAPGSEGESPSAGPMTLGLWDAGADDASAPELPDPEEAFHAGRAALAAGSFDDAAFRFGLAIRLAPALAPAVLEATDGARSVPIIVVRGDAYRLVGHESEARQAYALAASGGPPERRHRPRVGPGSEGPPADPGAAPTPGEASTTGGAADATGTAFPPDMTDAAVLAHASEATAATDEAPSLPSVDAEAPDAPDASDPRDASDDPDAPDHAEAGHASEPPDDLDASDMPDTPDTPDQLEDEARH